MQNGIFYYIYECIGVYFNVVAGRVRGKFNDFASGSSVTLHDNL